MFQPANNPKVRLYVRILAGIYLLHLARALFKAPEKSLLLTAWALLFALSGAAVVLTALGSLWRGAEEEALPSDPEEDDEEEDTEEEDDDLTPDPSDAAEDEEEEP